MSRAIAQRAWAERNGPSGSAWQSILQDYASASPARNRDLGALADAAGDDGKAAACRTAFTGTCPPTNGDDQPGRTVTWARSTTTRPCRPPTRLLISAGADTIITGLFAWNTTGTAATMNLSVQRASGQTEQLTTAFPVGAGMGAQVLEDRLMYLRGVLLRSGDSLHGSASAASTVSFLAFE